MGLGQHALEVTRPPLLMEQSGTPGRLVLIYVHEDTGADASSRWRISSVGYLGIRERH